MVQPPKGADVTPACMVLESLPPTTCTLCTFIRPTFDNGSTGPRDHTTAVMQLKPGIDESYKGVQLSQSQGRPPASQTCEEPTNCLLIS